MTSYCKSFIGFHFIITKNLSFYQKKSAKISSEIGGAADININFVEIRITYIII